MNEKEALQACKKSSESLRKSALLRSGALKNNPKWSAVKTIDKYGQLEPYSLYNPMSGRFQERFKSRILAMLSDDFYNFYEIIREYDLQHRCGAVPESVPNKRDLVIDFLNEEVASWITDEPVGLIVKKFKHQNARLLQYPNGFEKLSHEAFFSLLYAIKDGAFAEYEIEVFEEMLKDYIHWIYDGYVAKDPSPENDDEEPEIVYTTPDNRKCLFYEMVLLLCTGNLDAVRNYRRKRLKYQTEISLHAFCYFYEKAAKHWENPILKAWTKCGPNIKDVEGSGEWVLDPVCKKAYPAICFTGYALNSPMTNWVMKTAVGVWTE